MLPSPIELRRKYVISGYGLPLPFSCYDKIKSYTHLLTHSEFTNIDSWLLTGVQRERLDNINNITKPAIVYINNYQPKQDNNMLFVDPIELHCTHLEIGDNFLGPLINEEEEEIKEKTFGEVIRTLKIRDDEDDVLHCLLSKTDVDMNVEIEKAKMEMEHGVITTPYQNWLSQKQLPSDTLKKYIGFYVVDMQYMFDFPRKSTQ